MVAVCRVTRGRCVPEMMFCLRRRSDVIGTGRALCEMPSKAANSTLDIPEQADITFWYETALMRLRIFGNQPPKPMSIRHPDYLALYKRKLVFVLALKVKESNGLAVHLLVRRGDRELVIPRVSGLINFLHPWRGAGTFVFRVRVGNGIVICVLAGLLVRDLIRVAMVPRLVRRVRDVLPAGPIGFASLIDIVSLAAVTSCADVISPFAIKVIFTQDRLGLTTRYQRGAPMPSMTIGP